MDFRILQYNPQTPTHSISTNSTTFNNLHKKSSNQLDQSTTTSTYKQQYNTTMQWLWSIFAFFGWVTSVPVGRKEKRTEKKREKRRLKRRETREKKEMETDMEKA